MEDFKEGDYLLVTVSLKDSTPSIESVELAEVLTGEVSEYTETENVFIGGNEYKYNKLVGLRREQGRLHHRRGGPGGPGRLWLHPVRG